MKKLLVSLSIILVIGIGYFAYEKWAKDADLSLWSFVPQNAAVALEVELAKDLTSLTENPIWQDLLQSKGHSALKNGLAFLDSINGEGGFTTLFKKAPAIIAIHRVSNNSFGYLFIAEVQNLSQNTFISAAVGRMKEQGIKVKTRNYHGFKISEIGSGSKILTFIFHKNFFLASFTPYLVEDAIRTLDSGLPFRRIDPGSDIHINHDQLANLAESLTTAPVATTFDQSSFTYSTDSSTINLSGFTTLKDGWFKTHSSAPSIFEMAEVVPSNTAKFYHITNEDFSTWKNSQAELLKSNQAIQSLRDSLKATFDFEPNQVFDLLNEELGVAFLESSPSESKKLLLLKVKDTQEALTFFEDLAVRIAYSRGDSVYTESYSENEIRFLPFENLPFSIIGEITGSFERCFYVGLRDYIIFSNDLQELRRLIEAVQSEDTWGKSLTINRFLGETSSGANVSIYYNVPRYWNQALATLKPEWSAFFEENATFYKQIEFLAVQLIFESGNYFTNVTLMREEKQTFRSSGTNISPNNQVTFASPLLTKPFLVRTHAHGYFDIMLQDSSSTLYYLDNTFSNIWSKEIESPIVSEVRPIDYYRNGKLQYAFSTKSKVHIIDRNGNYIPGYPKNSPRNSVTEFFDVIDYEKNRNYRMASTDSDGKVYLTDKDLNILDGWDPIPYNRKSIAPLRHARLGRRDVMISVQENGVLNVRNRRGQKVAGFPFDAGSPIANQYFLSESNSLSRSSLTMLSTKGELVEINLEGNVIGREQLIKDTQDADFQIIADRGKKSFIIVREENGTYNFLDQTGNLLFFKNYLSEKIKIQFYDLGAGKDLIVVTDVDNSNLYLFDRSGSLVTGNPLNSGNEISLLYSSSRKELQIYTANGNSLEFYEFNY